LAVSSRRLKIAAGGRIGRGARTDGLSHNAFQQQGEKKMSSSTKDQVEGKFHEVKGKVKQKAGQAINSPDVESEGKPEKLAGKLSSSPAT
jgi:uncharacterized protein YjbJ (UPF0337 family)